MHTKVKEDLLCAPAPLSVCGPLIVPLLWLEPVSPARPVPLVLSAAGVEPALLRVDQIVPLSAYRKTCTVFFPEVTSNNVKKN